MQNRPPFWACAVALAAALACHAAQAQQSVQSVQSAPSDAVDEAGDGEAGNTLQAVTVKAVGDWLGSAEERNVQSHPGARSVIRRSEAQQEGLTTVREALNRIPGVNAPENNGTGSHDMALNIGIRGLNPRLASRSTLLMDGIPVPYAPYGQPQMSFGPVSLGLMDAVDVVRGGGAVRYGPQNVGGIINFVTRRIPEKPFAGDASVQLQSSPSSTQSSPKKTANLMLGGTAANGLGMALLYSGTRGSDWREHSETHIDDVILKGNYQFNPAHSAHAMVQHYEGRAEMPGGLTQANFNKDPYQSTRPIDGFWGRRTLAAAGYKYAQGERKASVNSFFTTTLRSGYLDQGRFNSLSPRYYWVRGIEGHLAQGFSTGLNSHHEIGIGYRYINEASHELRYRENTNSGVLPSPSSRNDRDTRGQTRAHAISIDDRIDLGDHWTITPGIRYERIRQRQYNLLSHRPYHGNYHTALPALNVMYWLRDGINFYANTEGSFGSMQYSRMPNRVRAQDISPEKARTWEVGMRYDIGALKADLDLFLINFNNQYESSQTTDSVTVRGKTRHKGLEGSFSYRLGHLNSALQGVELYGNYAFVDARIREAGPNRGNRVPFSSRHKGLLGVSYKQGGLKLGLENAFQSSQYADNANTVAASADGSTGRIPGYAVWHLRAGYDFGGTMSNLSLNMGVKNIFNRTFYTRSHDDSNTGLYLGQPRTVYVQASVKF
ncbi:TonB-dependent Fe(3+) dicitrate receptor FecA [uncultured Ottowia sp.]|uniref:TonB-dependent Fe(3+) dicitrate receptor FecA n=1 Tax=uncultured Ottowia sp. TaxID=543067 RepID=UPI002595AE18|nr:TonB-dependent Fe(3+) dicitrate receptor FecA [uncultured Ottowia sp.]